MLPAWKKKKSQIREECAAVQDKMQAEIDTREVTIEFLQRRYDQPKDYDGIAAWVEAFQRPAIPAPKAISRMLTKIQSVH